LESILLLVDRFYISPPTEERDSLWYFGITIINLIFCLYLAFSGILTENKYELIAFYVAAFLLGMRVALDYLWRDEDCVQSGLLGVCITSIVLVGVLYIFYLCLGYTIIKQMGWKFFREVSSEVELRQLYIQYQGFLSCLKLDFQMVIVILFTGLFYSGIGNFESGVILAICMSVLEVFWEILGYYAVRKEHVILFRLFITLGLILTPSYTTVYLIHFYSSPVTFDGVFTKFLIMAGLSVTNRLVLSYFSIQVYRNFNKGLRPKLFLLPTFGFLGSFFFKKSYPSFKYQW